MSGTRTIARPAARQVTRRCRRHRSPVVHAQPRPLAYDLFAGLGGAAIGLKRAGYDVTGFEQAALPCQTHRDNGLRVVEGDLAQTDWRSHPTPAVLWASPPCQPYSVGGLRRGGRDPRDGLGATLRAVAALLPPVVLIENVAGFALDRYAEERRRLIGGLSRHGYRSESRVLNCADYGIPQARRRYCLVARRDQEPIFWPLPTHGTPRRPWITAAEGLGAAHPRQLRPRWPDDGDTDWAFKRPAPTLVASFRPDVLARPAYRGPGAGPRQNAPGSLLISPQEALRLQGLPDDLCVAGGVSSQFRQIGNAVPPVLVEQLARANRPTTRAASRSGSGGAEQSPRPACLAELKEQWAFLNPTSTVVRHRCAGKAPHCRETHR